MDRLTQRARVLNDLRRAGLVGFCSERWYRGAIPNARNEISRLRSERYHIASFVCADDHGPNFAKYVLVHDNRRRCNSCPWSPRQLELLSATAAASA